ncbi:DNA-processing protein DprA [Agrococcus jejuensis]|uniref:DNA protecting protein DprA n=1 Tax=Agrococcus jejuensis TaxID=399736 RepID=A0A1G8GIM1_9MICO|nr:DNA-processing protein DprA [Agrococcus jejuensis]SDH94223.1 DNA protecting protein DprA [Agrococcus jejuensis]
MTRFRLPEATIRELVEGVAPPSLEQLDGDAAVRLFAAAAWSCIPEPGDAVAGTAREALGDVRALELLVDGAAPSRWLAEAGDVAPDLVRHMDAAVDRWRPRLDDARVRRAFEQGAAWGQTLLSPLADEWPAGLDDLGPHAPAALWVRGSLAALAETRRSIALVGSRAASGYGEHVAMEAVEGLVRHGFATVSGAAYGIDACVHRATMAVGGTTIAVMAGGLDRLYPPGNDDLLRRVEREGAIVAEVPCGSTPSRWRFLARNRLIAALAQATVVVEASVRSGSINTAGHAATLGRPLGAVPGPVTSGASAGCHRLIRDYGAQLVQGADEMRALVDGDAMPVGLDARAGAEETRVLDALSIRQPRDADDLAARAGMSLAEVRATLGLLDLSGVVEQRGSGWVRRATPA